MAKPNNFRISRFGVSADRAAFGDLQVQRYAFSVDQHRPSVDKLLPGTVVFLVAEQRREGKEELHGLGFAGRRQFASLSNSPAFFLSKSAHSWPAHRVYLRREGNMDHNESVRKFEHLMIKEADHAHEAATELEALVSLLPSERSRQLAQLQVKASHKQAKEFRELAQKVKES
jgi:hypothetical protein